MIVFDGYLTGNAYKYFINKVITNESKVMIVLLLFTFPAFLVFSIKTNTLIPGMSSLFILTALSPLFVKSCYTKKTQKRMNLKKIVINVEDGDIKSITDTTIVCNYISKVKEVRDYGEYYDIVFPLIHLTSVFVCQKNLISKGSLEEFERVFEGKIKRM